MKPRHFMKTASVLAAMCCISGAAVAWAPDPSYAVIVTPATIVDGVPLTDRFDTRVIYRTISAATPALLDERVRAIAATLGQTCVTNVRLVDGKVDPDALAKVVDGLSVIDGKS